MKTRIICTILVCLFSVVLALGEEPHAAASADKEGVQLSVGYLYQRSQGTFGNSGFSLNGGRADVLLPLSKNLGVAAEFSGMRSGGIPGAGTGLTLLTYMAGPRFSVRLRRSHQRQVVPFAQVLFGGTHASDGLFPNGLSVTSTANSFAMSAGGGMQVGVTHRLSVRVIQAEYLYTRLPNLFDGYQNNYRVGAGVVVR